MGINDSYLPVLSRPAPSALTTLIEVSRMDRARHPLRHADRVIPPEVLAGIRKAGLGDLGPHRQERHPGRPSWAREQLNGGCVLFRLHTPPVAKLRRAAHGTI